VNSRAPYKLDLTPNFRSWVTRLKKAHYRKRLREQAAFDGILASYYDQFEKAPHSVPSAWPEGWPNTAHDGRFKFYKADFKMPGLSGAAGQGRIMWLVCDETTTVHVIWVYTHAEFGKRPPDKDLRRALKEATDEAVQAVSELAEAIRKKNQTPPTLPAPPPPPLALESVEAPGSEDERS
jgi:hypothetical protein